MWSNALSGTNYTVQTAISLGGGANWVDYVQLPVTNRVNTNRIFDPNPPAGMALIPAGMFHDGGQSGRTPIIHGDAARAYVSMFRRFTWIRSDVTYALWQQVYNWAIEHGYSFANAGSGKAANHPVQAMDWYDAVKWCNARSEMEGRTPAYYTNAVADDGVSHR